jgi:site-specific recombinase XerD
MFLLESWLRDFLLDARAARRSDATLEFYQQKLHTFLNFSEEQGVIEPEQLSAHHIRLFLDHLGESRNAGGVHAYWRAVRAFVRFLVREEAIDSSPLDKIRSPKVEQELLEPVSTETVSALLCTCDKTNIGLRDRAILLILLDTGLRAGELLALNVGDVDLNEASVAVRKAKSRQGRYVFIGRQARKAVVAYLRTRQEREPHHPLWLAYHRDGNQARLRYDGLRSVIQRRAKQAGVPCPSLHSFRRGFAINMLRNGADLVSLSRMMGHGSLPVLMRYLNQLTDDLRQVHARCSPVDTLL